jgi:hypothetical protein
MIETSTSAPSEAHGSRPVASARLGPARGGAAPFLVAGALYAVLSIGLWWNVWSASPSGVMTCDCTDAGRMVWYLRWSAFALDNGHQLLFSNWLLHPGGFNLLTDTSVPLIGFLISPVTLLLGPVTAINTASTLIPALTGLSMFWLLRRWVRWAPAAFIGGLVYGFGPLVVVQLSFGWLNLACLALLPPMVACLDELLIRQHRRPILVGAVLAVLVAAEFFISTEMVEIAVLSMLVAVLLVLGYSLVKQPDELARRWPSAAKALAGAAGLCALLLAYPIWFFLAGPSHLSGMVWSTNVPGDLGNSFSNFWSHLAQWGPVSATVLTKEAPNLGGYAGPAGPSPSYLGVGMLAVLVVGSVIWRKDRRLWLFGALGVITAALSLRVTPAHPGPWSIFYHLSILDNTVQSRFDAVFVLCAAAMLAVIVDRTRSNVAEWLPRHLDGSPSGTSHPGQGSAWRWTTGAVAVAVAVVALVPMIAVMAPNLPLDVQPVTVPTWFTEASPRLAAGQVLATYPFATANSQSSIPWQAISGMHFKMAGGGGPSATEARAGAYKAGFAVLDAASVPIGPAPAPNHANLAAVRAALRGWGVTMVVIPDDRGLPTYQTGRGSSWGSGFFTAVLGSLPTRQDGAWVWTDVAKAPPSLDISSAAFNACLPLDQGGVPTAPDAPRCVLRSSSPSTSATS